jgi:hypothetical protein
MRFRLLRRRLTISAPRMAVRSALPWPFRWLVMAIVLGFSAAVALWAFEFGKNIAGLDGSSKEELTHLREEMARVKLERDQAQSVMNTSGSLLTAERAAQEKLTAQIRTLEAENQSLRDDLGFFEKLIPSAGGNGVAVRSLQAEIQATGQLRWQVLVMQATRNAPDFKGVLELTLMGTLADKPWSLTLPAVPLQFRQYRRMENLVDLPAAVVLKSVSAKVMEGTTTRAVQSIKM